jgi:RNA polymerase sigma-70 factor (ECF subfamily)
MSLTRKGKAMQGSTAEPFKDLNGLPDAKLVQLARQKDSGAFRTIIKRHNRRLYRLARAVTANDSDAEDAVQEAYFRAFTSLDQFRGASSLTTWLSRIVLNEALGRLRRRRPTVDLEVIDHRPPSEGQVIPFPLASPQLDPERTMAQREIQHLLEKAIDDLPEAFRTVLVARVIEEMSVKETADLFGLRVETVKTRLHRARGLLKQALEKHVSALTDVFPFDGRRCDRMTSLVLQRFGLPD